MTETIDRQADTTRQQILRAASIQFAQRPYHEVSLDDILVKAELTKGAMYFHFSSKHALALAIIEKQNTTFRVAIQDLLARKLSGLETLVDFSVFMAVQDISQDEARAALHLVGSVGLSDGLQRRLLSDWIETLAIVVRRAIAEKDISEQCGPEDVARLIVSLCMGMRQTSNLDEPDQFLRDLEKNWGLVLNGIAQPDRIGYFRQFIKRRIGLAISTTSTQLDSD